MRITPFPLRALLLGSGLLLTSCIIAIDDNGASVHGFGHYNSSSSSNTLYGSGHRDVRSIQVEPYTSLVSQGSWDVTIDVRPDLATSLEVEGDDNILEFVTVENKDGTLYVSLEPGSYSMKRNLVVRTNTAMLNGVRLEGSGDIDVRGVDAETFDVRLWGSGDVRATGMAQTLNVDLQGSGDIQCFGLEAQNVRVHVQGSGEAMVNATQNLDAEVSGSGEVIYRGKPKKTVHVTGSGEIYAD